MREIPYELPISHPPPFFDRSKERERVRESWSTIPSRRTEGKSFCSNKPEKGKEVEAADEALAIYIYIRTFVRRNEHGWCVNGRPIYRAQHPV